MAKKKTKTSRKRAKPQIINNRSRVALWKISLEITYGDQIILFDHMSGAKSFGTKEDALYWITFHMPLHQDLRWFPERYVMYPEKKRLSEQPKRMQEQNRRRSYGHD